MLDLAKMKRSQYASYNPRFHHPATNARDAHRPFLALQLEQENNVVLAINGFIIATTRPVPPVYNIGGLSTRLDDFMVRDPSL